MNKGQVIVIEDDQDVRLGYLQLLALEGLEAQGVDSVEKARRTIVDDFPGVVVTDIRLPGEDGLAYMRELCRRDPSLPVVVITGHADIATAVQAMRDGAYDFLQKPFAPQHLVDTVLRALEKRRLALEVRSLKRQLAAFGGLESRLIGTSAPMRQLRRLIQDIAPTPTDVMILGETGTGKELLARCIHDLSGRTGPFTALNCGGLPESLFDSEIFGHEQGAFSGAAKQRIGKIEFANRGTLFLDEIESMPISMQIKLLRVLQERVIERLGSNRLIKVDIRVIAATKTDLSELSATGKFRSDLHFRLNVISLELPPLRHRHEDIPLLVEHFLAQAALRLDRPQPMVDAHMMQELMAYAWPGNVRELRNHTERMVLGLKGMPGQQPGERELSLAQAVEDFERGLIIDQLRRQHGNISRAATALHVAKTTLFGKIQKYAIDPNDANL